MQYTIFVKNILLLSITLFLLSCAADPYETISVGDSREKIITLLGKPGNIDNDLSSKRKELITLNLKNLDNHDSKYFSIWKSDEDLVYVIGFNKDEKVAVKHRFVFIKGT